MTRAPRVAVPLEYTLQIAARDRWTCHVCDQGWDVSDPWEIDHEIPLAVGEARGGTNHLRNLRLSHRSCNRDKAAS